MEGVSQFGMARMRDRDLGRFASLDAARPQKSMVCSGVGLRVDGGGVCRLQGG